MYCSNCATEISADQQFCRSCGTALNTEKPAGRDNFRYLMTISLVVCFLGVFAAVSGEMLVGKWLSLVGVSISLAGLLSMMIVAMFGDARPKRKRTTPTSTEPQTLVANTTNKLLPVGANDFIPSVTEKTTDLLKEPNNLER